MAILELDEHHSTMHECNNARPDFINDDDGMDEEEKETAFMQPPFHDKRSQIKSLTYQNVRQMDSERWRLQWPIRPQTPVENTQIGTHNISKKQRSIQQAHLWLRMLNQCWNGHSITHIEPHIQKYIPVPHAVRPQLLAVLDQMLKYGIIRECNEL